MSKVILLPCSDDTARNNFKETVERGHSVSSLKTHMTSSYAALTNAFPDVARFWGVRARLGRLNSSTGVRGANQKPNTWDLAASGDFVAFTANKKIFAVGLVGLKFEDPQLAQHLWGPPSDGRSYQYMLALRNVYSVSLPVEGLLRAIGDDGDKDWVQEFRALDDTKSALAREYLVLGDGDYRNQPLPPVGDGATDAVSQAKRRLEHEKLSAWVKGQAHGQCSLCHRDFGGDSFLVTAHVKKRQWCSDTERNDLANIAMAACKLGCDALYEAGLIAVDPNGQLIASDLLSDSVPLEDYFNENLKGKVCKNWSSGSQGYFEWHRATTFRRPVALP